ncbi:MAG: ATP synthase F0 subunit C [Bacteroidales bacterium]
MLLLSVILQAASYAAAISKVGAALAASISLVGASYGISKIGVTALEAIARQPEAAGDVRSNMIVSAALIEGVAFFAIVVCLLVLFL